MSMNDYKRPAFLPDAISATLKKRPIRLGTRQSPLALAQAHMAAANLRDIYGLEQNQVELVTMVATGDRIQDRALREVGGKALWTRELDRALLDGEIDAAVHSLKDVETIRDPAFTLAAMLPRADARDMLLGAKSLDDIPKNAVLGTSSPRRASQIRHMRPDMTTVLFRGNVATRLGKLENKEADVTLLAAAGIDRLGLDLAGVRLPLDIWLPAPSQGAIGIETLTENTEMRGVLMAMDDHQTSNCVAVERAFLLGLDGDCHSPIAAHACFQGDKIMLRAELYSEDGQDKVSGEKSLQVGDMATPVQFAQSLLHDAPQSIKKLFAA